MWNCVTVFVDAPSSGCQIALFTFGDDSYTRKYDIKISQYECGSESSGPPGCLQYYTATTGKIASFNYPTSSSTVSTTGKVVIN